MSFTEWKRDLHNKTIDYAIMYLRFFNFLDEKQLDNATRYLLSLKE